MDCARTPAVKASTNPNAECSAANCLLSPSLRRRDAKQAQSQRLALAGPRDEFLHVSVGLIVGDLFGHEVISCMVG